MSWNPTILVVLSGLFFRPACLHFYTVVEKPMTWPEAQNHCRRNFEDLATISSDGDANNLNVAAAGHYNDHLWIGLYDDITSWRWSLQGEGGGTHFLMWKNGEPNNNLGLENCVEMDSQGWNDCVCDISHPFVCYSEIGNSSSSYVFVNEQRNWSDAQTYCRQNFTDLVSVRNQSEFGQITVLSQSSLVWIGLHRDAWGWSDGSPAAFRKMIPPIDQQNKYSKNLCVVLHKGRWEAQVCQDRLSFVCNAAPGTQQIVKLTLTKSASGVNLEDAAEAIRQQLRDILKDSGRAEDAQLTWRRQLDGKVFHLDTKEDEEPAEIGCSHYT